MFKITKMPTVARKHRFSDTSTTTKPGLPSYKIPSAFAKKPVPTDFKTVQKLLAEELRSNQLYNSTWQVAKNDLAAKKKKLSSDHFSPTIPEECYIAVIAYTLDTEIGQLALYQDFNYEFRALKDEASWTKFPYKSLFYLLVKATKGIKNKPNITHTVYRGISNIFFSPDPRRGDNFYFNYFASTTTDRSTAESFMGDNGTLIEIQGGATMAIGISAYSYYDGEDEVLVFPQNKFRVKSFKKGKLVAGKRKDVLVVEKAGVVS